MISPGWAVPPRRRMSLAVGSRSLYIWNFPTSVLCPGHMDCLGLRFLYDVLHREVQSLSQWPLWRVLSGSSTIFP